jgi:hypothetical protein
MSTASVKIDRSSAEKNTFGLPTGEPIRRELVRVFRRQRARLLEQLEPKRKDDLGGLPPMMPALDMPSEPFTPLLSTYWDRSGQSFYAKLGLDPNAWRVTNPHIALKIQHATLSFCASTNATTSKALAKALADTRSALHAGVVTRGESVPTLTKKVNAIFDAAETWRARRIAQTEASRAVHAGQEQAGRESGLVTGWEWLLSGDACPLCQTIARRAKYVQLGQPFAVIGENRSYASVQFPPGHPHCNCTMVEVLSGGPQPSWAATLVQPKPEAQDYPGGKLPGQPKPEPFTSPHPFVPDRVAKPEGRPAPPERPPGDTIIPKPVPPAKPKKPRKPRTKPTSAAAIAGFPPDPDALGVVRQLGGSTGAELVKDAEGNLFVRKRGSSADHLREECFADGAYQALGVRVPEFRLYETKRGPVKLAKFVEGRTLASVTAADPKLAAKAVEDLRRHFAVDALLGNWDVIGLSRDNIIVDAAGNAWRIDNGGALRFRAQGVRKGDQWNGWPVELWTLRDPAVNAQTAEVFGSLTIDRLAEQIRSIEGKTLKLPADLAQVVGARAEQLRDVAGITKTLRDDQFTETYTDGFTKHTIGIRKAGISERMPKQFKQTGAGSVVVLDENGKRWDQLRGPGSLVSDLSKYVESSGGKWATIRGWMGGQAGDSWGSQPRALKRFLADARGSDYNKYWWKPGFDPKACGDQLAVYAGMVNGLPNYSTAMQSLHAFTYELLRKVDFPRKKKRSLTIDLMRTEDVRAMRLNSLTRGQKQVTMPRGVAESCSIFKKTSVYGTELTRQTVPLHRVIATYWMERYPGHDGAAFLSDSENEFVAILEGVPFDYGS